MIKGNEAGSVDVVVWNGYPTDLPSVKIPTIANSRPEAENSEEVKTTEAADFNKTVAEIKERVNKFTSENTSGAN